MYSNDDRDRWHKSITPLALAASLALGATAVQAAQETVQITIPKAAVAAAFNTALQGTQIRLDNYRGKDPIKKKSGNKANVSWLSQESYIRLPNGKTFKFNIPEQERQVGSLKRYLRHYVSDFNSQSIQVGAHGTGLDLTIHFESQGREIKGKCIVWRPGQQKWTTCKNKLDRDMQLDNAWAKLHLVPVAYKGGITYKKLSTNSVDFKGDLKVLSKLCSLANQQCQTIGNAIYNQLRGKVRQQMAAGLNREQVRARVAALVKARLSQYVDAQWTITKVASQGSNFIVTVTRPAVIGANTVTISHFNVKQKKASVTCPGKVDFTATLIAKHPVKGKAWLEYLSPKQGASAKRNLSIPKTGSATSTLSQAWDRPAKPGGLNGMNLQSKAPGSGYATGKTRLVIQWKGSNGKTYTKKSQPVSFQRKCKPVSGPGKLTKQAPPAQRPAPQVETVPMPVLPLRQP